MALQYFQDNILWLPPDSTCLFYTRGMTATARDFAKKGMNRFTTIWVSDQNHTWTYHQHRPSAESLFRCPDLAPRISGPATTIMTTRKT